MAAASIFEQILDYTNRADPYRLCRELRGTPVVGETNGYRSMANGYRDTGVLLPRDPRISARSGDPQGVTAMDPPEHDQLRRILNWRYGLSTTPDRIERMRPLSPEIVTGLIDRFVGKTEVDLGGDFACSLPVAAIYRLLGVPLDDEQPFHVWFDAILQGIGPRVDERAPRQADAAFAEMNEYLSTLLDAHRDMPGKDLLSALVADDGTAKAMARAELAANPTLLLFAGHNSVINPIPHGMLTLLRHPAMLERFRQEPDFAVGAVEELLRREPPFHSLIREALDDIGLAHTVITPGGMIHLAHGASSRIPDHVRGPDGFGAVRHDLEHADFSPQETRTPGFGDGVHHCCGAPLASAETQMAPTEPTRRLENPRALTDTSPCRVDPSFADAPPSASERVTCPAAAPRVAELATASYSLPGDREHAGDEAKVGRWKAARPDLDRWFAGAKAPDAGQGQFPVTRTLFGSPQARELQSRLARWRPTYWPLILSYLVIVASDIWFTGPIVGLLGWPLTVVWSWQIFTTFTGIFGIRRTRKALRTSEARWSGRGPTRSGDLLIVVVPTIGRHDTYPALERSVLSYIAHLSQCFPRLRIDIVIDEGCEATGRIARLAAGSELIRLVTVPRWYRTANGTRFKARATHYSHELRIHEYEDRDDVWVLHMDDDTGVGPDTALAIAQFIEEQFQAGGDAKHLAQGILTYPREYAVNRLTWLADSARPAEDVGRFSFWTGSGTPRAGVHGELLLVRASIEATIGWDFGPRSLVEDAQFALVFSARYKGRSAWFCGRSYGASPASLRDFFRQRERWSWGLAGLVFNRSLQLRNRLLLGYSVMTWVVGPLQNVGVVLLLSVLVGDSRTSPVTLLVIPIWALNIAYTIWMYWEGLRVNAGVSDGGRRKWWEPLAVILLIPLFGLMEGIPGLCGFAKFARRAENKFMVIAKPS